MPIEMRNIEIPIQRTAQTIPGRPVAAAMLAASECMFVKPAMKVSSSRLNIALSKHWTAKKATAKFAHFWFANRATAKRPAVKAMPDITVNARLPSVTFAKKFQVGARTPKTTVRTAIIPDEMYSKRFDGRPNLIHASSAAPKAVVPTYPALETNNCENQPEPDE